MERVLTVLDKAKLELAQLKHEIAGSLRVAAYATSAAALLPPVIHALRLQYPRLQMRQSECQ